MSNIDDAAVIIGTTVALFLFSTYRILKAIEVWKECLVVLNNILMYKQSPTLLKIYESIHGLMIQAYCRINDYQSATQHSRKLLALHRECGSRAKEGKMLIKMAGMYKYQYKYGEATDTYEKALALSHEIGDRRIEAQSYSGLGNIQKDHGKHAKAEEYLKKALAINIEIGDRYAEATDYRDLGTVYHLLGENVNAMECTHHELLIRKEIGDRTGEASCYDRQGKLFLSRGEYLKANEYYEEALLITKEMGDRKGEASSYSGLGTVCYSRGEYIKSIAYHQKALAITKEINYRIGEAESYKKLGTVFYSRGEYYKAKESYEKDLAIRKEIGDRKGEASSYGYLGAMSCDLGEFFKAKEYHEKAFEISKRIGDRTGEATSNLNLGVVFYLTGEFVKAIHYEEKALKIKQDIGEREGESTICRCLGAAFYQLGQFAKANEYHEKGLEIAQAIGDRKAQAEAYSDLGISCQAIGKYDNAKEHFKRALAMNKELCDREGEGKNYGNLGTVYQYLGKCAEAEENVKKALTISQEIGNVSNQVKLICKLTWLTFLQGNVQEAQIHLLSSIEKCDEMQGLLGSNDQYKIGFSDKQDFPFWKLTELLCSTGTYKEAVCVSEFGRARALADLMAAQYSMESQVSANPQYWVGVERIIMKESACTCLSIVYSAENLFLLVIKNSGVVHFRQTKVNENSGHSGGKTEVDDFFAKNFRTFTTLNEKNCEDRSLNAVQPTPKLFPEDIVTDIRGAEENNGGQIGEPVLALCYQLIIAPVAELFEEPEIIIVPDGPLYKVPFAALSDESGKCLSETFRIRIVPSLTTLKLIQDGPTDHHNHNGALIVGDPDVGLVCYKGRTKSISRLPCAGKEAEMIGRLLEVPPLLGKRATKEAVLERLNVVSLIHFAAHADFDTGEIALAPKCTTARKIPQEEDYLLKMSDISKVQLRAKLVVLSCCHSGRGQIKAEGVVGIARAFLGSGARSVLVALWAIEDSATEQFMRRFYEHLVRGESASESLHETMKWMRGNGFSHVSQWAPFMLIGDNVTFDFKNEM